VSHTCATTWHVHFARDLRRALILCRIELANRIDGSSVSDFLRERRERSTRDRLEISPRRRGGAAMRRARGRNAACVYNARNTLRTRAGKQTQSNQFARLIDFPSHARCTARVTARRSAAPENEREREREREREGGGETAQRVVQIQSETPV